LGGDGGGEDGRRDGGVVGLRRGRRRGRRSSREDGEGLGFGATRDSGEGGKGRTIFLLFFCEGGSSFFEAKV